MAIQHPLASLHIATPFLIRSARERTLSLVCTRRAQCSLQARTARYEAFGESTPSMPPQFDATLEKGAPSAQSRLSDEKVPCAHVRGMAFADMNTPCPTCQLLREQVFTPQVALRHQDHLHNTPAHFPNIRISGPMWDSQFRPFLLCSMRSMRGGQRISKHQQRLCLPLGRPCSQ